MEYYKGMNKDLSHWLSSHAYRQTAMVTVAALALMLNAV